MEPHEVMDNIKALAVGSEAFERRREWFLHRWSPADPRQRAQFESNLKVLLHAYSNDIVMPILNHLQYEIELLNRLKP